MSAPLDPRRRTSTRRIATWRDGVAIERDDLLVGEEPAQISVAGPGQAPIDVAVTMRTPGGDDELAVGFLVSEALIQPSDVDRVSFGDPLHASQPENHIVDRKSTRLNSSHMSESRMPSSA